MAHQLFLFNLIDGSPAVPTVEVAPVAVRPVAAPVLKAKPAPAAIKVMDLVVILPFKGPDGKDHGAFLKTPGVVVGFNAVGMALVDVGIPGNLYAASLWRVVRMDD